MECVEGDGVYGHCRGCSRIEIVITLGRILYKISKEEGAVLPRSLLDPYSLICIFCCMFFLTALILHLKAQLAPDC